MYRGFGLPDTDPLNQIARTNQYALVSYIGSKLGDFLLQLRQEIVPGCQLRSHVSILPPRPLTGSEEEASVSVQMLAHRFAAFEVGLEAVEVFPVTNVIYIALGAGLEQLRTMHAGMNYDGLEYREPFPYHPHITLAQEIPAPQQASALELCERRWQEWRGPRTFAVERLTFVHYTAECGWVDVAEARLEFAAARR